MFLAIKRSARIPSMPKNMKHGQIRKHVCMFGQKIYLKVENLEPREAMIVSACFF